MPLQVWIAGSLMMVFVLVVIAILDDGLGRMQHFAVLAAIAVFLGNMVNLGVWMTTPIETRTVVDSGWTAHSGVVDYEQSDLSSFGHPRFVITKSGARVKVERTGFYPRGATLNFVCPKQEWQGRRRLGCQVGEAPTKEVETDRPFSVKVVSISVGLALVEGGLILLLGRASLRWQARPKKAK